jgi:hypothetical protein
VSPKLELDHAQHSCQNTVLSATRCCVQRAPMPKGLLQPKVNCLQTKKLKVGPELAQRHRASNNHSKTQHCQPNNANPTSPVLLPACQASGKPQALSIVVDNRFPPRKGRLCSESQQRCLLTSLPQAYTRAMAASTRNGRSPIHR